jgi:hypothetical protein
MLTNSDLGVVFFRDQKIVNSTQLDCKEVNKFPRSKKLPCVDNKIQIELIYT